jgi:hypothetical protein
MFLTSPLEIVIFGFICEDVRYQEKELRIAYFAEHIPLLFLDKIVHPDVTIKILTPFTTHKQIKVVCILQQAYY